MVQIVRTPDIPYWGGTTLTGRDISLDLARLDIALSVLRDALLADESYTTATHGAVTVGTTSVVALSANSNRVYALFINDSDTVIYLKLGAAAVVNQGIRLNASGGAYEMSKKIGNLYKEAINAITSAANKNLLVIEGV